MKGKALSHPVVESPDRALSLWDEAVLRANDLGGWTKAAPQLYPHRWCWDTGNCPSAKFKDVAEADKAVV